MQYIRANPDLVREYLLAHLQITGAALAIALLIALPLGTLLASRPLLTGPVMGLLGLLYTIPSLALIILLIPFTGLNAKSVTIALIIYAQVILVRNIVAGLTGIDRAILEAARGMGMNAWQRWWRVQIPLALPVILAGVRIAAVVCIGIATIGAKFNAGGLGVLLFQGISQGGRADKIWAGALAVGGLALVVNTALLLLERALSPATRVRSAERRLVARRGVPPGTESEVIGEGAGIRGCAVAVSLAWRGGRRGAPDASPGLSIGAG
ncbi:MAG TPA: ABC transporter permease [Chloroflexia bacterium]|nr:ABC transporter permease [Chloroflexia bacterium]